MRQLLFSTCPQKKIWNIFSWEIFFDSPYFLLKIEKNDFWLSPSIETKKFKYQVYFKFRTISEKYTENPLEKKVGQNWV